MRQPNPDRESLVMHATAMVVVVAINLLVVRLNSTVGTLLLPLSAFSIFIFLVRLTAPFYLKTRVMNFLKKNGGSVSYESLMTFLTLAGTPEKTLANEQAASDLIRRLEKEGCLRVDGSTVRRAR